MRLSIFPIALGVFIGAWLAINDQSANLFFQQFFVSLAEWWESVKGGQ